MLNRRAFLCTSILATLTVPCTRARAQEEKVFVRVTYPSLKAIPEGRIRIFVPDQAVPSSETGGQGLREKLLITDGNTDFEEFSLPVSFAAARPVQIIAHLERTDGWLLARGSVRLSHAKDVVIQLTKVMY
ncbi:hypothetical protein JM93_02573 [Roseibium hamelinense]|uniref:Uncharacterized protein n=1 Tax=Roseibium hamelinense TaxID=150831 RepID=A0A562T151_9HYPH|nr:hypothetical protein JM93_02573 [Roseibium hamelinense]